MKNSKIIFIGWLVLLVVLVGCEDEVEHSADNQLNKELVENVMKLDQEAVNLTIQNGWYRKRLESCISQLEKMQGLDEMPFNWSEATGFPAPQKDPDTIQKTIESISFYLPFPKLTMLSDVSEKYRNPELLSIYTKKQLTLRQQNWLGVKDKYLEHLEKRLRRLDSSFKEN